MLRGVLSDVQLLVDHNESIATTISTLSAPGGTIDHCKGILENLLDLIPAAPESENGIVTGQRGARGIFKKKLEAVKSGLHWGRRQGNAQKLLGELGRYKGSINLALTAKSR